MKARSRKGQILSIGEEGGRKIGSKMGGLRHRVSSRSTTVSTRSLKPTRATRAWPHRAIRARVMANGISALDRTVAAEASIDMNTQGPRFLNGRPGIGELRKEPLERARDVAGPPPKAVHVHVAPPEPESLGARVEISDQEARWGFHGFHRV
jgi:hypothetical protein